MHVGDLAKRIFGRDLLAICKVHRVDTPRTRLGDGSEPGDVSTACGSRRISVAKQPTRYRRRY